MTEEERLRLKQMLNEIDNNYKELGLPEIDPQYDEKGNLTNKKDIDKKIAMFTLLVSALWLKNANIIDKYGVITMNYHFSTIARKKIAKGYTTLITPREWNGIIDKIVKDRAKKVKIKQVIRGNAKRLNKRLQNTVKSMYKQGKSKPQIAKELQKQLGYNAGKAKSIAVTEVNYYKSEAQLEAIKGVPTRKVWQYNRIAKEPRTHHREANGLVANEDGYFIVGGRKTTAPQHFGIPSEDISCHCTMRVEIE